MDIKYCFSILNSLQPTSGQTTPICPSTPSIDVDAPSTATAASCDDYARATASAYDCMINQKCQQNFDAVARCFGTNTPHPGAFSNDLVAAEHCCLCENYIFNLAQPWDVCAACAETLHDDERVAQSLVQPWHDAGVAFRAFCARAAPDTRDGFVAAFAAVADVWSPFAAFNPAAPGFVLDTCGAGAGVAASTAVAESSSSALLGSVGGSAGSTTGMESAAPATTATASTSGPALRSSSTAAVSTPPTTISTPSQPTPSPSPSASVNAWTGKSDAPGARSSLLAGVVLGAVLAPAMLLWMAPLGGERLHVV